ncbi:hypothetical protein [Spiroplasma endosymbiont of Virgichneumon dumeticola]|uniref:hypothetical protein n=1 Tax=Spiroplasma endosymbiont of Virgichneumon dumeticola TaxID=3139323 RepID=UPI0035C89A6D
MKSMKNLFRILSAVTLTGLSVTTVVACGPVKTATITTMNGVVSDTLGLTTDNGTKGIKLPAVNGEMKWDVLTVSASHLLKTLGADLSQAQNQESFDFITTILKIQPDYGSTFADGLFNSAGKIREIRATSTNTVLELTPTANDFTITSGTFDLQFNNYTNKENIGPVYTVSIKIGAGVKDAINTALASDIAFQKMDLRLIFQDLLKKLLVSQQLH